MDVFKSGLFFIWQGEMKRLKSCEKKTTTKKKHFRLLGDTEKSNVPLRVWPRQTTDGRLSLDAVADANRRGDKHSAGGRPSASVCVCVLYLQHTEY